MLRQLYKNLMFLCFIIPIVSRAQTADKYARIDAQYAKVPNSEARDVEGLALYLTHDLTNEDEKVRSIYTWICHNIKYDYTSFQKCKNVKYTPKKVLKQRKAMCEGYVILFKALCDAAHINAVQLDGYAKTEDFDTYDHFYKPEHSWNAVMVDDKWRLIDATWGAGGIGVKYTKTRKIIHRFIHKVKPYKPKPDFVFDFNDKYFLTPPSEFILDHAPIDPVWQLLPSELPINIFETDDAGIKKYEKDNALISGALRHTDYQDPYSKEIDVIRKICDRAYKYNNRFNTILAVKEMAIADQIITDSISDKNPELAAKAKAHYTSAIDYLKRNKTSIDEEYRLLQQKNTAKKVMLMNENKMLKRINKYIENKAKTNNENGKKALETLEMKVDEAAAKEPAASRGLNAQGSNGDSKTADERSKLLSTLQASRKEIRLERASIERRKAKVKKWQHITEAALDSIKYGLENGDSLINAEVVLRLSMYDSYKKQVKAVRNPLIRIKQNVDSVYGHKLYGYLDSIKITECDINADLRKIKTQLKDEISQLRQNQQLTNTELIRWHNQDVDSVNAIDDEINTRMANQLDFIQTIVPVYIPICNSYKEQDKAFAFEEKVEKKRFEKVKKRLELKKKKEIENNQKNIELIKKKIEKLSEYK